MSDKDVELKIGADGSQANAEFDKVASAAEKAGARITQTMREASYNMASSIKSSSESIIGSFEKVNKMLLGFTAILAGGAAFKEALGESNKLTMEANKLGNQLGISATDAGVLNVAMKDLNANLGYNGITSETVLNANNKLTKTLGTNELAFKDLGVQTRDTNGHFRNSLDIMLDVNSKLLGFKEGTDRNIEGQKIYGKQWKEVQGILGMTKDKMEEARKKSEELGLVIGKENVEATTNYRVAMNDVEDVLSGMMKTVGDALMPILTDMGNWFASVGPEAVIAMKGAIGAVAATFYGLKMAVEIVWEVIKLFVRTSVNVLLSFAEAAEKALKFDFAGAKQAWKTGAEAITSDFDAALDRLVTKAEANRDKLIKLFDTPVTPTAKKEGGENSEGGAQKNGRSQVGEWKAELEAKKEAEGQFFKDSLADDEAFWAEKLNHVRKGSKDEIAIKHELFGIHKQMAQQQQAEDLAAAKEQQTLDGLKVDRARDAGLAQLDIDRENLTLAKSLGQITDQQEIAALQKLEQQKYQIEEKAAQDKIALEELTGSAKQKQLDELAKMEEKHNLEIVKLNNKSVLAVQKDWGTMLSSVSSAFDKSITGMIMGTQTLQKAIANIGQSILAEFVNLGVKRVTTWASNEMAMLLASKAKNSAVATLNATGTTTAMTAKGTEATAVVTSDAAEGAAGAAASQAAIPVIGPGLAVAAFAATMALILGARSLIKSSAGGEWQVPHDRLNIVHKDETILPAHIAGPLREMVANGGSMGGGHTFNITAMDSRDVLRALQHGGALHKALTGLNRNFAKV